MALALAVAPKAVFAQEAGSGQSAPRRAVADTGPGDDAFVVTIDGQPLGEDGTTASPAPVQTAAPDPEPQVDLVYDGLQVTPRLGLQVTALGKDSLRVRASSNYPAFISKAEILLRDARQDPDQPPLASFSVPINAETQLTIPAELSRGRMLSYTLRVRDDAGRQDETVPRLPSPGDDARPGADRAGQDIADDTAYRNIPVAGAALTIRGRELPAQGTTLALDERMAPDAKGALAVQRILPPGAQSVRVVVQDAGGQPVLQLDRDLKVPDSEWFYAGIADFTIGKRRGDAGITAVRPEDYHGTYTDGRLAFYAKGRIKGDYRLTISADTDEDRLSQLLDQPRSGSPRDLLRRMDIEDHYPVYGDDSTIVNDAPSSGKLYVRLEDQNSHIGWGNYRAGVRSGQLIDSDRALYGLDAGYQSPETTPSGERRTVATAYAARPGTLPQRDEFRATGGSSYFLKRQDVLAGSQTIAVEYRDAVSGRVIERRPLQEGQDYRIDSLQGVVILTRPLAASAPVQGPLRDGPLGSNQAYLVAEYEFIPPNDSLRGSAYGGRMEAWVNDNLRLGVSAVAEGERHAARRVLGLDALLRQSERTYLSAEIARAQGAGGAVSRSTDGGLTFQDGSIGAGASRPAPAVHLEARADLAEITQGALAGDLQAYYQRKARGFGDQFDDLSVGQTTFGAAARILLDPRTTLALSHDSFNQTAARDPLRNREIGDRSRRESAITLTRQLNEDWSLAFGAARTEQHVPPAQRADRPGHDGKRTDIGLRLERNLGDGANVYVFGQKTLRRQGDIRRNDRLGLGGTYALNPALAVSAELSGGTGGLGAAVGVDYAPSDATGAYLTYRLDQDRAYSLTQPYDLTGKDRGTVVIGARRQLGADLSSFVESNVDLYGRRRSVTRTYGLTYTPGDLWTIDAGVETGRVEDDLIATTVDGGDFDRRATSLSATLNDEPGGISARIRGELRRERSDDGRRDIRASLLSSGLAIRTDDDWRLLMDLDAAITKGTASARFAKGKYIEASVGYAYRPVKDDRLNGLFRYSWHYDLPAPDQISAITQTRDGPAQKVHILSADFTYRLNPTWSIGAKYGFRSGRIRDRAAGSDWSRSQAHLGILRADYHALHNWDILLEARMMALPQADTDETGALIAVYRHLGDNFKIGVGQNFGRFSDDLRDLTLDDRGLFLNIVGTF